MLINYKAIKSTVIYQFKNSTLFRINASSNLTNNYHYACCINVFQLAIKLLLLESIKVIALYLF